MRRSPVPKPLSRRLRVVALGGGTGLSTLLRGLKEYTSRITAVVAVTDDGEAQADCVRKWACCLLEIFEIVWLHWQMLSRS